MLRIRYTGYHNMPRSGGGLICANHQSHLDPLLVGLIFGRRLNYLARATLFRIPPFRWLLQSVNAIPIDREGMGLAGLKATLRRLEQGELVLIFPEGTRSRDGKVARLKPGFCALARRGKVPLLPVGVEGAFQAWPRNRMFPAPGVVHLHVGRAISAQQVAKLNDDELIAEIESRIRACHERACRQRSHVVRTA